MPVDELLFGAAAALRYENDEDPQSVELQKAIQTAGADAALARYSGLTAEHPLSARILDIYHTLDIKFPQKELPAYAGSFSVVFNVIKEYKRHDL